MAERLKEVDVVVIGVGMVGSIVAKELAAAGYTGGGLGARPSALYGARVPESRPFMTNCVSTCARH